MDRHATEGAPLQHQSVVTSDRLFEWRSPEEHARMLLEWLRENGLVDGCILAADMRALHDEMCQALGWMPRAWNPIGRALAVRCTSGRKVYAHIGGRRMRVYPLPTSGRRSVEVRVVSDSRRVAA